LEKFPKQVLGVGKPVGGLRRAVAEELGLKPDTPVTEASVDAYAGALGLRVAEPGTLALITGSSHVIIAQSADPVHDPGFWGTYTDAMIPGLYTIEAGQTSTGSIVAWFKDQLAGGVLAEAQRRGICYGTEDILRTLRDNEIVPKMNVVSGGPAKSELWMQIHADVSNVPITFTKVSERPVLGADRYRELYPAIREVQHSVVWHADAGGSETAAADS
jgi:ribulose kinase